MDNAVNERRGEDFANFRVEDNKGDRGAGAIVLFEYGAGEIAEELTPPDFKIMLVVGFALVLAGIFERFGEFAE